MWSTLLVRRTWPMAVWATSHLVGCDVAPFSNDAECKYPTASVLLSVLLTVLLVVGGTTAFRAVAA